MADHKLDNSKELKALASFEITSIALGYRTLNEVSLLASVRVLEGVATSPSRFLILVEAEHDTLVEVTDVVRQVCETTVEDALTDHFIAAPLDVRFLPALYSLEKKDLKEALLIVECESASGLLQAAHLLLQSAEIDAIDIKMLSGLGGKGLGFFTGSSRELSIAAETVRSKLKQSMRDCRVEIADRLSPVLREFF